jgi:hypothetical protein
VVNRQANETKHLAVSAMETNMMEAASTYEMSVNSYHTTRRYNQEDRHLQHLFSKDFENGGRKLDYNNKIISTQTYNKTDLLFVPFLEYLVALCQLQRLYKEITD